MTGSLQGPSDNAAFGFSEASGDFDGDGFMDLAVGIPFDNNQRGSVNVFRGSANGISQLGIQGWKQGAAGIGGADEPGDRFGYSLAAGDFNGDNVADLAIGVPGDNTAAGRTGSVHVLYGSKNIGLVSSGSQLWSQGNGGVPGVAEPGDSFGLSLAVGDFNNDGYADLAIGVPGDNTAAGKSGSVHVLYGLKNTGLVSAGNQLLSQGSGGVPGVAESGDLFGYSLAAGDFNGDNVADLAVGVPGDNTAGVKAGAVNVLYGSATGLGQGLVPPVSQTWSQGSGGVPGVGGSGDLFGYSLAAGDFNGDNVADLAVGVPGDDIGGARDAGSVNVLYGSATGITALHSQLWDQTGLDENGGVEAGDAFGSALVAGDFDGDGVADLAIGVPGEDIPAGSGNVVDAGSVNVLYGTVNHPPDANAGADQTVPVANDNCFARVQLDGTGSSDQDGDPLTYTWTWSSGTASGPKPEIVLTRGTYTITLTVDDGFGGTDTDEVVVTVVDLTPPVIMGIQANPEILWPPNHKFVQVTFTVRAKDNCDNALDLDSQIVSVSSNEPVNGLGDGDTAPDWVVTGPLTANIRAERSGTGSGRVYTATISVTDSSGNVAMGTEDVVVPHDKR